MSDALNIFRYILNKFIQLIFSDMTIENGVTIGWVIISIVVMGVLASSVLNIPNNIRFNKRYEGRPIKSQKGVNNGR